MYSTPPREGGYVPIFRKENRGSEKTVIYDVAFCYKVHLETISSLLVLPLFICLFINDLLSIYYVQSIVLGAWETAGKKRKHPALLKPTFSWKEGQRQANYDKQHP